MKKYAAVGNNWEECTQENGIHPSCVGNEKTDANGNSVRVICVAHPVFDNSLRVVSSQFIKQIKLADTDNWLTAKVYDPIVADDSRYRVKFGHPQFGQQCEVGHEAAQTAVQFFLDNIYFNVNNLPLSIAAFAIELMNELLNDEKTNKI